MQVPFQIRPARSEHLLQHSAELGSLIDPRKLQYASYLPAHPLAIDKNHFDIIQWISGRKEAEPTEGDTQHQNQSKPVPQFAYDNRCALLIIIIPTHAHWPPLCINQIHFATAKSFVIISTGEWRGSQHRRMSRRKQTKPRHLDAEEEENGLTILEDGRLSFLSFNRFCPKHFLFVLVMFWSTLEKCLSDAAQCIGMWNPEVSPPYKRGQTY